MTSWGQTDIFDQGGGGTLPSGWVHDEGGGSNTFYKSGYWLLDAATPVDVLTTSTYDLSSYTDAEFSVDIRSFGSGSHTQLKVEVSYDGGATYTQTSTTSSTTTSFLTRTITLNQVSNQVKLRLSPNQTNRRGIRLRDLILEASGVAVTGPTLEADPLTAFGDTCVNTTATEQSFILLGENLTSDNVVVNALSGYTYSTDEVTYTSTLTFTPVAGEVLEEVYVRFTPTTETSYDGNITISGGGVDPAINVAVSGDGVSSAPATVTTSAATSIATTTATLGGNVTGEGCSTVTARGVVIGTSSNPSIGDGGVTDYPAVSGGAGTYTVSATGLVSSTQYYIRAYATNGNGTAYGAEETFSTPCGDFNLPFTEDFEDTTFTPTCWTSFRGTNGLGTGQDWERITSDTYNTSAGSAFISYENVSGGDAEDWLVTPGIVLPDTDGTIELSFQEIQDFETNWGTNFYIKIATSNPSDHASYTDLISYDESDMPNHETGTYAERIIDLTAYEGQTVYIAFVMVQDDGDSWYIDDVSVRETAPAVATPVATAATYISATTFTANWNTAVGATSYRLDVSTEPTFSSGGAGLTELIISEYVEGGDPGPGNNRAIELYNGTGAAIDLSEYSIAQNSQSKYTLSGTLADGATYVIVNSEAAAATLAEADLTVAFAETTALSFTGDDNFNLYKNFVLIDQVGDLSGVGTENVTLRRKSSISSPSTSYTSSEWDSYAINNVDDLGSHTASGGSTPSFVTGYEDLNVGDVTSYEVTGLDPETTYYFRVRGASDSDTSGNSNVISVTTGKENVWNGAAWTAGSAPTTIDDALIEGAYNTGESEGEFTASVVHINTGGSVVVASGTSLTVINAVNNTQTASDFIVENNANLIQTNPSATNTGNVQVMKDSSPLYRLDYTLWSAPVVGQNLQSFSPQTLSNRFYDYNEGTDVYAAINPSSNSFEAGKGYLIRMANNHPAYVDVDTPGTVWTGTFEGVMNNGRTTVATTTTSNGFNLVGNPYPSPINIAAFYAANTGTIGGASALYFWRKTNDSGATTYASVTSAAYTANAAAGGDTGSTIFTGDSSNWVINIGQGFFVEATGASVVFDNTMRMDANNGQFFRSAQDETVQTSRLWLNLAAEGKFSQMAIVYNENMTLDLDYGWDGEALVGDGAVTLYSTVAATNLAIQARPAFDTTDEVTVGFYAEEAGAYTISLDHVDGLFTGDQDIYLIDHVTGQLIDIKNNDYQFTTEAGTINDRFSVVYDQAFLGTDNPVLDINEVVVYQNNGSIIVDAGALDIIAVTVYDMRGRALYTNNSVNASETVISNLKTEQQVLLINITTNKGTVTKKVVL
ncbi:MAG: hypothetical protein BM557_04360 [Flavobacterium sp. MedPE-SWcel]|nr:MAG: hypothetical protein BM557_04360 [Flavobacterium sp. MedPE-SWcel]